MQLLESRRARVRSRGTATVSVVVHAAIFAAAIVGTATAGLPDARPDAQKIYFAPIPKPSPAAPAAPVARRSTGAPTVASAPTLPDVRPVDVGVAIPDGIPTIDVRLGDPSAGIVERLGEGVGGAGGQGTAVEPGGVYSDALVERAVVALPGTAPRYPEMLRGQGIEGRVVARFVVDTAGRVEAGTVRIVSSAHPAFADAVRRTLPAMRFRPAEARGQRVRQLVDMPFEFVLSGR